MLKILHGRKDVWGSSNLSIVVVPALEGPHPSQWVDTSGAWLRILVDDVAPKAEVWTWEYSVTKATLPSQRVISEEGFEFLQALVQHCSKTSMHFVPVVLISHGTGGLVVKKMLQLLHQSFYRFQSTIEQISGAIFFGVPHITQDQAQAKISLEQLLKCQSTNIFKSELPPFRDEDFVSVLELCNNVESLNLSVPILTVYESRGTKTHRSLFSRLRGSARNPVEDHSGICRVLVYGSTFVEIAKIVKEALVPRTTVLSFASSDQGYHHPERLSNSTIFPFLPLSAINTVPLNTEYTGAEIDSTSNDFEIVPTTEWSDTLIPGPQLPYFSTKVPERHNLFHGHQDVLEMLDKALLPPSIVTMGDNEAEDKDTPGLRAFALCGLGGIGKTETAIEYAHRRRDVFGAVFWVRSEGHHTLAEDFMQIAEILGIEHDSHDSVVTLNLIQTWLGAPVRKMKKEDIIEFEEVHWLLIFDGANDLDALFDYWPTNGQGSVLVTSRDSTGRAQPPINHLEMDPLTSEDSVEMLQDVAYRIIDDTEHGALLAITERLGGIPLAIMQAASIIERQQLTYAKFLQLYEEQGVNALQFGRSTRNQAEGRTLWQIWIADLPANAKALLEIISLLVPDDIPEALLIRQDLDQLKLEDYPKSIFECHQAKWLLLSQTLIRQDKKTQKLSIHPMVQDTVKAAMDEERLVKSVNIAVFLFRSVGFPRSSTVSELLLPSFFQVQNIVRQLVTSPSSFVLDIELYQLCSEVSAYLLEKGIAEGLGALQNLTSIIEEQLQINKLTQTNRVLGDRMPISDLRETGMEELSLGVIEYEQKQPPESEAKDKRPSQNPIRISNEKDVEEHSSDNETPAGVSDIQDDFSSIRSEKSLILPFFTIKRRLDLAVWWNHLLTSLGIVEPPLAKRRQRLRWQCACGHEGFDDLEELAQDGIFWLRQRIEEGTGFTTTVSSNANAGYSYPTRAATGRACRRMWTNTRNWFAGSDLSTSQDSSSLPRHTPVPLVTIQTSQPTTLPPPAPLLLLSCMRKGKGKRLFQDCVKQVGNDQELIHFLRDIYNKHRCKYRSVFSLRDVQYLTLVKLQLLLGGTVAALRHEVNCKSYNCECLPPMNLVLSGPEAEYTCDPITADSEPPLPPELLKHLFDEPECVQRTQQWILAQIPKRIKGKLEGHNSKPVFGWGIEFREGQSPSKIMWLVLVVFIMSSVVFGVVWTVMKKDLQGAFGVSGWLVTLGAILLTLTVLQKNEA